MQAKHRASSFDDLGHEGATLHVALAGVKGFLQVIEPGQLESQRVLAEFHVDHRGRSKIDRLACLDRRLSPIIASPYTGTRAMPAVARNARGAAAL
jgi:hypothetical protein